MMSSPRAASETIDALSSQAGTAAMNCVSITSRNNIVLIQLPPYAPELSPMENVWA